MRIGDLLRKEILIVRHVAAFMRSILRSLSNNRLAARRFDRFVVLQLVEFSAEILVGKEELDGLPFIVY